MRRCARYGDYWLPYMYTPERLASSLAAITGFADERTKQSPIEPALFLFYAVHEDRDAARKMAIDRLSVQYNQDFSALVGKYALAGNPDDCIARLREYADAGARTVILNAACPGDYMADNQALLASSVLPAFGD